MLLSASVGTRIQTEEEKKSRTGDKERIQSRETGWQREGGFSENDSWQKKVLACRKSKAESAFHTSKTAGNQEHSSNLNSIACNITAI